MYFVFEKQKGLIKSIRSAFEICCLLLTEISVKGSNFIVSKECNNKIVDYFRNKFNHLQKRI